MGLEKHYKVLVIGLDGATYDLIKPWAEQGKLPTIQRLLKEGAAGELESTVPPMTAPAWTSFMTGMNPGKHGLYDWIYRHRHSYDVSPVTAEHCQEPPLWRILSHADRRVCLINIPMTFPPQPVNGLLISGMPAPSKKVTITFPSNLLSQLEAELGEYLLYPDPGQAYSDSGVDEFIDRLYRTTEMRLKVLHHLRAREDWDFCMLVFNGTDTVQHAMWKYMDSQHPLHDPAKAEKYGDAILAYFQYVDRALGEIADSLDEQTVLMLMSDHGFGPFHKFIHVNNWLRQEGFLKIRRRPWSMFKAGLFRLGFAPMAIYNFLMRFGFGRLKREVVRGQGQGLLKTLFLSFGDVDWPRTQAYSLGNVGQIRINVRGREPQGRVEPGETYEAVREEIIARLKELRDPQTGEAVVQEIYRREEIYSGKNLEEASDIVFIPTRMEYFGFGEYEFGSNQVIEQMRRGISGTHRPNGMFLLWGPPVKKGAWHDNAQIIDLAPTILHLLGESVPSNMDGSVLEAAFAADLGPVRVIDTEEQTRADEADGTGEGLSSEEKEIIVKRLRDMGYVG